MSSVNLQFHFIYDDRYDGVIANRSVDMSKVDGPESFVDACGSVDDFDGLVVLFVG